MGSTRDAPDSALLQDWRAGDASAGKQLFERYYDAVIRFFRNKVAGDVSDLVQDTFAGCLAGRDRLRDDASFRSYLFSIAYNVLRDHLRTRYRVGEAIDMAEVSIQDLGPSPSAVVARRQEERLLLEALRSIPIEHQTVLELRYWEGLKSIEIAQFLSVPHGTARSRLRRAREALESALVRLAPSAAALTSTQENLEAWARECRAAMADVDDAPQHRS